jgi:hypothetical protein
MPNTSWGKATESSARVLYDSSFSIVGLQLKSQVVPSREILKPEWYLPSLASSSSVSLSPSDLGNMVASEVHN